MNTLLKRSVKKNIINNRKTKNLFADSKTKFTFKNDMKSVDIPEILFTNFFQSKNEYFKIVKKEYKGLINGREDVIDSYNMKYINRNPEIENKINKIMLNTYGYALKLPMMWRLSKKGNPKLQFIVVEKTAEIIFIDLYHLFIPAADREHGESIKNPQLTYDECKEYRYDLKNIFE